MTVVPIFDAKNRLPFFIHLAEEEGPVMISRRNQEVAVLLSKEEYERLVKQAQGNSFLKKAEDFRRRNKALFSNEEIDRIFEEAKDKSTGGPSGEASVFSGLLEDC